MTRKKIALALVISLLLTLSGCIGAETAPENTSAQMENRSEDTRDTSSGSGQITVSDEYLDVDKSRVIENLRQRRKREKAELNESNLGIDFHFEYATNRSGIGFEHGSTPDSGKLYKPNHYDHGSGVAVADVNGDGYLDVYFANQIGPNELWVNRGDGTFKNSTTPSLSLSDRVSSGVSFGDMNNDGAPDLYVTTIRGGNELFVNMGGELVRRTDEAGVGYTGHSSASVFFDYNNDGYLDLFVVNVGNFTTEKRGEGGYYIGHDLSFDNHMNPEMSEQSILYENQGGGTFVDVSEEVSLTNRDWSGDATPTYFKENDRPGLYVLNMQGDDSYYVNGKGGFTEHTKDTFGDTPWGAMGVKTFDYDNDAGLELYLTDMHSDMHDSRVGGIPLEKEREKLPERYRDDAFYEDTEDNVFGNAFYEDRGDGFDEVSEGLNLENLWPWGLSAGDVNADGYTDVFVTASMNYQFRYIPSYLMMNDHGDRFYHAEFSSGIEPRRNNKTHKEWFSVERDGGEVTAMGPLGSRSSVVFDMDNDGDLDILTNEFNSRPRVLENHLSEKEYLKVDLVGKKSNRDGLGARVVVHTEGEEYTKYNDGQSGYLSQSSKPLYFGLDEESAERVVVDWPSGETTDIRVNEGKRKVEVEEVPDG